MKRSYKKNSRVKRLVVLDFDETLFFTSVAIKRATKRLLGRKDLSITEIRKLPRDLKIKIYRLAYSRYRDHSIPNTKLLAHLSKYQKDYRRVILTARGEDLRNHTISLVKKHKIKIDGYHFRKDLSHKDEDWKLQKLKKFVKRYPIVELYEDKKENIDYIKNNINAQNIKYYLVTKRGARPYS